jgi:hypothetical protein
MCFRLVYNLMRLIWEYNVSMSYTYHLMPPFLLTKVCRFEESLPYLPNTTPLRSDNHASRRPPLIEYI